MFEYEWKMLFVALSILVGAMFVTHALATPAIAVPAWIDQSGDNIGVPDIPRHRSVGAAMIGVQMDFAGESEMRFFVTSETMGETHDIPSANERTRLYEPLARGYAYPRGFGRSEAGRQSVGSSGSLSVGHIH